MSRAWISRSLADPWMTPPTSGWWMRSLALGRATRSSF